MRARSPSFIFVLLALVACRGSGDGEGAPPTLTLTVFAASSLREVVDALAAEHEAAVPGVKVQRHFAGTPALRTQLEQGAHVDLFLAADTSTPEALASAGELEAPVPFARNSMVLVLSPEAHRRDLTFDRLPEVERLVLAAAEVPAGRYAREALDKAAVRLGSPWKAAVLARRVSDELDVRRATMLVVEGEADAALVYRSEARAAGAKIVEVELPEDARVDATYAGAVARRSLAPVEARALLERLRGPAGRVHLERAGLRPISP
jgi:molybdate transport system substrate-binding protein